MGRDATQKARRLLTDRRHIYGSVDTAQISALATGFEAGRGWPRLVSPPPSRHAAVQVLPACLLARAGGAVGLRGLPAAGAPLALAEPWLQASNWDGRVDDRSVAPGSAGDCWRSDAHGPVQHLSAHRQRSTASKQAALGATDRLSGPGGALVIHWANSSE